MELLWKFCASYPRKFTYLRWKIQSGSNDLPLLACIYEEEYAISTHTVNVKLCNLICM